MEELLGGGFGGCGRVDWAPHSFKLTSSRVSSIGVVIGHYECDGEIKVVDGALDSPSEREIARQERMKRED